MIPMGAYVQYIRCAQYIICALNLCTHLCECYQVSCECLVCTYVLQYVHTYVHDTYGRICTVVYMMSTIHTYVHMFISMSGTRCLLNVYGVATVSRIHKITGLFCRMSSLLQGSFAKPTYNFIDPTNHSHPVVCTGHIWAHICIVVHYMCIMHMYASLRVV